VDEVMLRHFEEALTDPTEIDGKEGRHRRIMEHLKLIKAELEMIEEEYNKLNGTDL